MEEAGGMPSGCSAVDAVGGGSCDAGAGDGEDVRECGRVAGVGWGAEEGCEECEEGERRKTGSCVRWSMRRWRRRGGSMRCRV